MISRHIIENEVKNVFGEDVRVVVTYEINYDGYAIRIYPKGCDDLICAEVTISGLEELQNSGKELLDLLRVKLKTVYESIKQELKD